MSDIFKKTEGPEADVDEIMSKIREEVEQRKQLPAQKPAHGKNNAESIFWKYGLKYARFIKKIPVVKNIAEKYFWRIANKQSGSGTKLGLPIETHFDLENDLNYRGFLEELRHLGLKGKIKLFIFKFIGFFAWWQEQINSALYQEFANQRAKIEDVSNRLATLSRTEDALYQELTNQRISRSETERVILAQIRDQKLNILDQQRRLTFFLEEAKKRLSEPISKGQLENMAKEEDHLLDAMYVAFEDRFRGTTEDIKERQRIYLPYIERVNAGAEDAPVLDIGSGRGEWLELLKENGRIARGVDTNRVMLALCREHGFDVVESDALTFLRDQASNHFGAITGFHIVEHLPPRMLVELFDEALRTLRPGGIVIFETPNPENLIVGSCNFYYDPTHKKPLPPDLLRFIAEQRGFVSTEILRLQKIKEPQYTGRESIDEIILRFNMEQDYSIIGYKV